LNEILRLYPVVPMNGRVCVEDTVLPLGGGRDGQSPILVRKGTRILTLPYGLHRREDIYGTDALELKPERWENLKPAYGFNAFGAGPRICIGQQLALTTASYTVVRLLQAFKEIRPGDESAWRERMTLAMSCEDGCHVVLTPA